MSGPLEVVVGGLLLSVLWWVTGATAVVSAGALVRPIKRLRLGTRRRAAIALAGCIALIEVIANWPVRLTGVAAPMSHLDETTPAYHYTEVHSRQVNASPERVYEAIRTVTAGEIRLLQTLTWIRRLGQPAPEGVLNAPKSQPFLDTALKNGFVLLADDPPREIVVATIVAAPRSARGRGPLTTELYRAVNEPGFVKAAMNFRIEPERAGSLVTTETRVLGTDPRIIRRFTPYWRTILPGSWMLRVSWLDAVARRAEHEAR